MINIDQMKNNLKDKIPYKTYQLIIKHVPMPCVDLIIWKDDKVLLSKRKIPPYKGKWHTPGGIIRKRETVIAAVKRIAQKELSSEIKKLHFVGFYENLRANRHDITLAFLCEMKSYDFIPDFQSQEFKFFKRIPMSTIPFQKIMIADSRFLLKKLK